MLQLFWQDSQKQQSIIKNMMSQVILMMNHRDKFGIHFLTSSFKTKYTLRHKKQSRWSVFLLFDQHPAGSVTRIKMRIILPDQML